MQTIIEAYQQYATNKKDFTNSDTFLQQQCQQIIKERQQKGWGDLVGDLQGIIISVEPQNLNQAVAQFCTYSGYQPVQRFTRQSSQAVVCKLQNSADVLFYTRQQGSSEFKDINIAPKTQGLPNTRLETYFFTCTDLDAYVKIQEERGVRFAHKIHDFPGYRYIQTIPSSYTGNSYGFIEWKANKTYVTGPELPLDLDIKQYPWQKNIGLLDHAATRLPARYRDYAIMEFMELTAYSFDLAIYVKDHNSITNVARMPNANFALVFTSGIKDAANSQEPGPTEQFVQNYGSRTHHLAFVTKNIEHTFESLKQAGQTFLLELVGSEADGLKQTFTTPAPQTLLVYEYIWRYGDFDGFFTRSNVTSLTKATANQ